MVSGFVTSRSLAVKHWLIRIDGTFADAVNALKKFVFLRLSTNMHKIEQAFWSQYSLQTDEPTHSGTTMVEVPKELLKVSMRARGGLSIPMLVFRDDIIPFVKILKELFTSFDQCLIDEMIEVQKIFKQMEMAVKQHYAEKTKFQTKMENVLNENDRILTHALSVEIANIVVHDCMNVNCLNVDACEHCVTTESELKIDFIKKECYETLLK
nr:hypothetical protein [Tanacetum cinerariifolium]